MRNSLLIAGAFAAQIVIVVIMLGIAVEPLWTGREIEVVALSVDRRDTADVEQTSLSLHGDYAQLSYPFNRIQLHTVHTDIELGSKIRYGQEFFVVIDELSQYASVRGLYTYPQDSVTFITGRARFSIDSVKLLDSIYIDYGVEKFYTSSEDAKVLEEDIQDDSTIVVTLMVNSSGRARIKSLAGGSGP